MNHRDNGILSVRDLRDKARFYGEVPTLRVTCRWCDATRTVSGASKAEAWIRYHRKAHDNPVFFHTEIVRTT